MLIVSKTQARHLQLAAQGLLQRPTRRATRAALLATIARMQLLQIDTINIAQAIRASAKWHQTPKIAAEYCDWRELRALLQHVGSEGEV